MRRSARSVGDGDPAAEALRAAGVTHWSSRRLADWLRRAKGIEVSHDSIARLWRRFCLAPHRTEGFKFSTDPELDAKVRDVVGLYLRPPGNAVVICVDEKSQCQALERTQPILPMRPGIPERQAYDYARHGVTTLFAAMEVATGQVTDACYPRHRHQEFLRFLKKVAAAYPRTELHVICDNYAAHKHADVRAWLAGNPRITLHFTPTDAPGSTWWSASSRSSPARPISALPAPAPSVRQLTPKPSAPSIDGWNTTTPEPFAWTKDADDDPRPRSTAPKD
jgi:transposase